MEQGKNTKIFIQENFSKIKDLTLLFKAIYEG